MLFWIGELFNLMFPGPWPSRPFVVLAPSAGKDFVQCFSVPVSSLLQLPPVRLRLPGTKAILRQYTNIKNYLQTIYLKLIIRCAGYHICQYCPRRNLCGVQQL